MTQSVDPGIFTGGQMSQLPSYPSTPLVGTDLMEIVTPNVANYSIAIARLAALLPGYSYVNTLLTSGATLASPYTVPATVTRLLVEKTVPSDTYIVLGNSTTYPVPLLIRDSGGNADTYNIHVTFSGGQLIDGMSEVIIRDAYYGYWFNPLTSGGWYLGNQ